MKVVAIIQARVGSTRLPGKVLKEAAGLSLIAHMIRRVKRCLSVDKLWLATSKNIENDPLEDIIKREGVLVYRGSEDDVLSRYWEIARVERAGWIVRLTGDCPLHDPQVIDAVTHFAKNHADQYDYVGNALIPTYPDGLDVEVIAMDALDKAYRQAISALDREHVTPYIHRFHDGPGPFRVAHYRGPADFSHLRWTLDQEEDFLFIREVYEKLYPIKPDFGWLDVVALLTKEPNLMRYNSHIQRNEGYLKALAQNAFVSS